MWVKTGSGGQQGVLGEGCLGDKESAPKSWELCRGAAGCCHCRDEHNTALPSQARSHLVRETDIHSSTRFIEHLLHVSDFSRC